MGWNGEEKRGNNKGIIINEGNVGATLPEGNAIERKGATMTYCSRKGSADTWNVIDHSISKWYFSYQLGYNVVKRGDTT
jgi:hypothetical protein